MKILLKFRYVIMVAAILTNAQADYEDSSEHSTKVIFVLRSNRNLLDVLLNSLRSDDYVSATDGYALRNGQTYDRKKEREERKKKELVIKQHKRKMKELNDYMKDHMISTNYFYEEMKRILKTRIVKNGLRKMVEYLEKEENSDMKTKTLKCFIELRKQKGKEYDVFQHPTNNLVINVVKDPYNDGFIN